MAEGSEQDLKSLVAQSVDWASLEIHEEEIDLEELLNVVTRYSDEKLIGEGAIKVVYEAYDHLLKRPVALARLKPSVRTSQDKSFLYEAWITSSLNHSHIISIHDIGIDSETRRPYFTMDLRAGDDFRHFVSRDPSLSELLAAIIKIGEALDYADQQGVLHLDLKPENIQCDQGEVMICDWGLSKQSLDHASQTPEIEALLCKVQSHTLYGEIKGSIGYMAPEQGEIDGIKDERTDVYALGCLLYYGLVGQDTLQGTPSEALTTLRTRDIPPPSSEFSSVSIPPALERVMLKALARDPEGRYCTVRAMISDLEAFREGRLTSLEHRSPYSLSRKFIARHRSAFNILTVALMVLLVAAGVVYQRHRQQEQKALAQAHELARLEQERQELERQQTSIKSQTESQMISSYLNSNVSWVSHPVVILEERLKSSYRLLKVSPNNERLIARISYIQCLRMNFQAAYQITKQGTVNPGFISNSFAQKYKEMRYNATTRPTIDTLVSFFNSCQDLAEEYKPKDSVFMFCGMIHYDWAARQDKEDYHRVIAALFQALNPQTTDPILTYDPDASMLRLKVFRGILLHGSSGSAMLRYAKARELVIEGPSTLSTATLDGVSCETLNLSGLQRIAFKEVSHLPNLRTVIVRKGRAPSSFIRKHLKAPQEYEIVYIP